MFIKLHALFFLIKLGNWQWDIIKFIHENSLHNYDQLQKFSGFVPENELKGFMTKCEEYELLFHTGDRSAATRKDNRHIISMAKKIRQIHVSLNKRAAR